jgi:hypothetical protein
MSPEMFHILVKLSEAEWHNRHEDVVTALDKLHDSRSVEALYHAALKRHAYLDYDDDRALAVKAIWALGKLGDTEADQKLRLLAESRVSYTSQRSEATLSQKRRGESRGARAH